MLRSYLCRSDGTVETDLGRAQLAGALQQENQLLWVDIEDPEDEEVEVLLETFGLHELTVEDCIMPNFRPKIEEFDHYLFVVLHGLCRREARGKLELAELDLCLGKNFLITARTAPVKCVEDIRSRIEKKSPLGRRGADFLFYALADALLDSYFPVIEEIEDRVDTVETKLLNDPDRRALADLLHVYNEIVVLRRTLTPHREIFARLYRGETPFLLPANTIYFRDIYDHVLRMSDLADSCREVVTVGVEAYATIVSNRLNEIMKTLTAIATMGLPLVIVTGIYGMNFGENPGLGPRWIYHLVAVGAMLSLPVMALFFRKYRWL